MFQSAGDFRLLEETGAAGVVVGVAFLKFLQRHFAGQFPVDRHMNLAQAAHVVKSEDAKARAQAPWNCRSQRQGRPMGRFRPSLPQSIQAALQAGIGQAFQFGPHRRHRTDGGQASLRIARMLLQVLLEEGRHQIETRPAEFARVPQDFGKGPMLLPEPALHGREEVFLADEGVLIGQNAEQQVTIVFRAEHGQLPGRTMPAF